jgi:F-type H+-transporting ATPase subunit b
MTNEFRELMNTAASTNPLLPAFPDILWSAVVFLVLLVFFWLKVLPSFKENIDARTEAIEGRLALAEKAQAEAAEKTANIEAEQALARTEAAQIRESARAEGAQIRAEMLETAAVEALRLTETAKKQIEAERQAAIISLRAEVGALAIDLASSVIKQSLKDDKNASSMVDGFLADLEKDSKKN